MRAIAALLLCLWLPVQAGTCPRVSDPGRCVLQGLDRVVRGKTIVDPLLTGSAVLSQPFKTDKGASGLLHSAVFDGVVMFQLVVDPGSLLPVAGFTLARQPAVGQAWATLENAAGDLRPDFVLQDSLEPTDISFAFANGLAPGQASYWIVDQTGGPVFAPAGLGTVTDPVGGASLVRPLLAPVPEPASAALLLGGLLALGLRRRAA